MASEAAVEERQAQVSQGIEQALSEAGGARDSVTAGPPTPRQAKPTGSCSSFRSASLGKGLNTQDSCFLGLIIHCSGDGYG